MDTRSGPLVQDPPSQLEYQAPLQSLEWYRLLDLAQDEARTEPGRYLLEQLEEMDSWAQSIPEARGMQQELLEITALLERDALWGPMSELPDPAAIFESLSRGGVLELDQLVVLRKWLYAVDSWIQIPRDEIRGDRIKKAISLLPDPFELLRILDGVLTPEGELSEKASPRLAVLFAETRALKREISVVLDQLLKTFDQRGILQESFTDVRDGRYVIPIRISAQNEVEGIIHDASASRQTVFVEPAEVAALNNRLRQRQNDLIQEIFIILTGISRRLDPFVSEIQIGVTILSHWDSVQAKARLGRHYGGKPIEITQDRQFRLSQTAHPLLWWSMSPDLIIRNDLEFGHPAKTLLLTGPNTGGKTVLLKTLGLAGVCARTGFPFPGTDHPIVPFFDSFYADLGDSQSIEQHLSSFSGHVMKFKEILDQMTPNSLILIDELNSATDPEEGAAFGRAVLETIMAENAMIVTTTHDPRLKALSVTDQRILTASMAFDESSRSPTYRMVMGVPGRSRALETAERLGIPEQVITLAKTYLSREHLEFEKVLSQLEFDVQTAARARKEAVALRDEAERMKKEWTERTESSIQDVMDRSKQRLKRMLEQAQDDVRATVRKLDATRSRREIDETRNKLNELFKESSTGLDRALAEEAPELVHVISKKAEVESPIEVPGTFEVGDLVRIPKWKNTGKVLEIMNGKIKVAMGTVQMSLPLSDVEALPASVAKGSKTQTHVRFQESGLSSNVSSGSDRGMSELDIRGLRFEEAMSQLESYLDHVFRNGSFAEVTVVHGLGTGALREGTVKLLRRLPYVKAFRDGGAGRGGSGATLVEFDRD